MRYTGGPCYPCIAYSHLQLVMLKTPIFESKIDFLSPYLVFAVQNVKFYLRRITTFLPNHLQNNLMIFLWNIFAQNSNIMLLASSNDGLHLYKNMSRFESTFQKTSLKRLGSLSLSLSFSLSKAVSVCHSLNEEKKMYFLSLLHFSANDRQRYLPIICKLHDSFNNS